jgi:hypothetical protein
MKAPHRNRSGLREAIRKELRNHSDYSNRRIARKLDTSHVTVAKVRAESNYWANNRETIGRDGIWRRRPAVGALSKQIDRAMTILDRALERLKSIAVTYHKPLAPGLGPDGERLKVVQAYQREAMAARRRLTYWAGKLNSKIAEFLER